MTPTAHENGHTIRCRLDTLLAERGMTLTELSERVGVSLVNLSILKNDRARAIRFSTLTAICAALKCDVGDVLYTERTSGDTGGAGGTEDAGGTGGTGGAHPAS